MLPLPMLFLANISATYLGVDVVGTESTSSGSQLNGIFNQISNPWTKSVSLGSATPLTLTYNNASLTSGVVSAFTGIRGDSPGPTSTAGVDLNVCAGASGTFAASTSGDPTIVYSWSPATELSSTSILNPTVTPTANRTYTLTIRDGNGITFSDAVDVILNTPTVTLGSSDADNTICAGQSVTFTALPAGQTNYEFFVNGISVQSSNVNLYNTSALLNGQTVTVRITNASSCSVLSSGITTTVNPNPVATLISSDGDNIICNGTSVTFTAAPRITDEL